MITFSNFGQQRFDREQGETNENPIDINLNVMANVKTKKKEKQKIFDSNDGQPVRWLLLMLLYKCLIIKDRIR